MPKIKIDESTLAPCTCGTKPQMWMTLDESEIKVECPYCGKQVIVSAGVVTINDTLFAMERWNARPFLSRKALKKLRGRNEKK